jgi:hypothetical protein
VACCDAWEIMASSMDRMAIDLHIVIATSAYAAVRILQ